MTIPSGSASSTRSLSGPRSSFATSRLVGVATDDVSIEASASSTSAPDGQSSFTTRTGDVATAKRKRPAAAITSAVYRPPDDYLYLAFHGGDMNASIARAKAAG